MENYILPNEDKIVAAVKSVLTGGVGLGAAAAGAASVLRFGGAALAGAPASAGFAEKSLLARPSFVKISKLGGSATASPP